MEGASSPGPGQGTMVEGMGSPEDGTVPTLTKEGLSGKVLPIFPARHPQRVRRKSKKCGICPQDEEEAGFFLRLRQSLDGDCWPTEGPPQSASPESPAGPQCLISSKDTGPGDPGGSWVDWAPEAELEHMLFSKNVAQPGSLDHLFGLSGLFEDECLNLVTQDPLQSPALSPGVLTGGSTEQQEAQPLFGSSGTPPDPEVPEVKAQSVSRIGLGQRLAAPAEPLGGLGGASPGRRRPKEVKKRRWTGREPCAPKQRIGNSSQDHPEEVLQRGCPGVEEGRVPCGVKVVYYVCSGPVVQLLGAFSNSQPEGQLETLEDLMKTSSARRQRRPTTSPSASCQCDLVETENEEPLQQRTEGPGEQDTMSLDVGVRSAVVRSMQEVLWTRVRELPDLLLREEEVASIAEDIEAALFHLTQDTNARYKTKYRSLLFNLKDPRNSDLFLRVAHCDVSPQDLVQMSSIQLAPKELSRWRDQEERRGLDTIEQQQKELYRLPTSKLTHKGEVEIPRDSDQMLTLEDLMASQCPVASRTVPLPDIHHSQKAALARLESLRESMIPRECSPQALTSPLEDTTDQHQHHFWDSNCHTCKDWKSSTQLPGFSGAIVNEEENVIQKAPGPAPVSSPEMLKTGETPSKEPQDRLQMPAGSENVLPSPPPWEGSLDMFSIKQFRAKAQLISGDRCQLAQALPEVIRSAGCLPPNDLWDLLDSMCPARAKDICVVRLCPHGSRDIQNYRLLYSYLNNRQRHCLVTVQSMKMVLLPLPAFQPLPARLRPLGGPGLETNHTSLLLAVLFPKDGLPDTAMSSPLWNKVPKTVSFNKKVERRCYQPEDRASEATLRRSPSHEEAPKQRLAKGSLTPSGCTWQSLPRGRGRQERGWGQQFPEASWCYPQHPNSSGPLFPGIGHGQHLHRASCFHQDLLQHLNVLVTLSHQFQASLWPPGQEPLFPISAGSAVADLPGPIPDPSLGPIDVGGSECPRPERHDLLEPPEQERSRGGGDAHL